ncbi:sugar phosphate nucleotidyltransferase [Miltoncostaea marina]|uniref:sugar phosphate nucleotidyltransferase n=1 Tax=Miltoncostaea marina TaxID=2843215 RepID=UPI001C3DD70A|nr:NDP-sugar synthase [Miltoncostaea marina]
MLVGGEGRRLRPLTDTRPKPMMRLVDRPFVAHQLDLLRRHGVRDVIFSCGYRPDALRAHFGDGASSGVRLRYVVDPEPLGTAGAIGNAAGLIDDEPFLVLNGDILTDLDIGGLREDHARSGATATVVLTPVEDPSAFGLVRLHDDRSVEEFVEKPAQEDLRPGEPFRINAGTYLLDPGVLERIPAGRACSIEREVFPALAGDGVLYGHPSDAYWRDIGTPASYLAAHHDVLRGALRTESPAGGAYVAPGAAVDPAAELDALACVGRDARVGPGARLVSCVVGERSVVGAGAVLDRCIVGDDVTVADGARIGPGAVLGDGARVPGGAVVEAGATVPTGGSA